MKRLLQKISAYLSDRFLELFYNELVEHPQPIPKPRQVKKDKKVKNQIKVFIDGNQDVLSKKGTYTVVPPPSPYNYINVKMFIEDQLVVEVEKMENKDYSSDGIDTPIQIYDKKIVPFFALNFDKHHEPKTIQFRLGIANTDTFWRIEVKYVEQTFS